MRIVSWRGRGIAFSDTICRSCAARVRIEGLWGSSPPTPVWPGSPQTALIFVGLPLLTVLVLLATPLHDPGPPPAREEAAAASPATTLPAREPRIAAGEAAAAAPPAVARRQPVDSGRVPPVIYEVRRTRHGAREDAEPAVSRPAPTVVATAPASMRRSTSSAPERITLAAAMPSVERRVAAALLAPQSP